MINNSGYCARFPAQYLKHFSKEEYPIMKDQLKPHQAVNFTKRSDFIVHSWGLKLPM